MTRSLTCNFIACLCALIIGAFIPVSATAQDCTGPNGNKGDILYNSTEVRFQGCTNRGWVAFHQGAQADPCTTTMTIGFACADGARYAGTHAGNRMYAAASDQNTSTTWKNSTGTNDINPDSSDDGLANTNQVPNSTTFRAFKFCKDLGAAWYLPAYNELQVILLNGAAIGGFSSGWYWSSTELNNNNAYQRDYPSGSGSSTFKNENNGYAVRCVRR